MIPADGEGSPAESGPGAPRLGGHRSESHLNSQRIGSCGRSGGCKLQLEPESESGAGRQGRVSVPAIPSGDGSEEIKIPNDPRPGKGSDCG